MKILVERDTFTEKSTTGTLYLDGQQFCWTLEPVHKDGKPGSCIPAGTYKVVTYPSPKFKRLMPLLVDVPGRSNIEMHWLNTPEQTDGCIGTGLTRDTDYIGESRMAFDDFWALVQGPMERGDCQITVVDVRPNVVLDASDL